MAAQIISRPQKKPHPRRRAVIAVAVVVVLVAAAGGWWYFGLRNQQTDTKQTTSGPVGVPIADPAALQAKIDQTSDKSKKAELYTDLASAQQLHGNTDAARDAASRAADLAPSADSYAKLAGIERMQGDNKDALEHYKKALSLMQLSSDNENTNYTYIKGQIIQLGGNV